MGSTLTVNLCKHKVWREKYGCSECAKEEKSGQRRHDVLKQAISLGLHGISATDEGVYTCHECGETWKKSSRWLWWPVSFRWGARGSSLWFHRHGIETTADRIEQRVYRQVWHFGRLKLVLGR